MKIVLIGIQGAGKSTQGNLMAEKLGIPYLSSGHIFRQMAAEKTPMGRLVKETINAGRLISDEMTNEVILEYLKKPEYKEGYILDGYPRTVAQAEAFGAGVDRVVFLDVTDKEALWRLSGRLDAREDETLAAIRKRIASFHEWTMPVLGYYETKKKLRRIDGEQEIDKVFQDTMEAVK